ncbi:MAG: type VI secretion system baseplate subunit TssK [Gemmatimonadales bacterium]|nr:MAG: type VI secretion system baseplate subunit TssK [Gemmatimonadales bacterium]
MRQLHGVLWTRGTLLTPQHLQVQDRYLQELMHFRLSALAYRPWGFQRLEVDREALSEGSLALSEAAGVFPDGLAFDLPASDPAPRPISLEDLEDSQGGEGVVVYLSVPEQRDGGRNVSSDAGEVDARYRSEVILRRDENTGRSEKPIQVARKNLRLAMAEGSSGSTLPVARIRRSAAGEFQLDPGFVPPLIDFAASERLRAVARRLVEVMSARSSELSASRRQRGVDLADFGVSDVASFWLLYTLNTHLPVLRHLFEARGGHPAELFDAMLRLAGSLTTFSTEIQPGDLPAYDHTGLGSCFGALEEAIHTLLATVIPQRHVSLPLRETSRAIYATALDQDRYLSATGVYLAVRSDLPDDELVRRFPQLAKVSAGDRVERLIKQALPGVSIRPLTAPPESIPVKLGRSYFELERVGEDWEAIRRARNVAVYVPSDFPGAELELVLLLPPE